MHKNRNTTNITRQALVCLLVLLWTHSVNGDSWETYTNHRLTDSTGTYYVSVKRVGKLGERYLHGYGRLELIIAQRKHGGPVVPSIRTKLDEHSRFDMNKSNEVDPREGDVIHGRVKLENTPGRILVSSTGLGVVLLDQYGMNLSLLNAGEPAVTILSLNGKILHAKKIVELFDEPALGNFYHGWSNIGWLQDSWIDEEKHEVVVLGLGKTNEDANSIAVINIDTGKVRHGTPQDLLQAITTRNHAGLAAALDSAIRSKTAVSVMELASILKDSALPFNARIRSAVMLCALGDKSGKDLMKSTLLLASNEMLKHPDNQDLENEKNWELYLYIVNHFLDFFAAEDLPMLRQVAKNQEYPVQTQRPFLGLKDKAVPFLIKMMEDDNDAGGQVLAADVLSQIPPHNEAVINALIKGLQSTKKHRDWYQVRWAAIAGLEKIGHPAKAALPALTRLTEDPEEETREAAKNAIAKISGSK